MIQMLRQESISGQIDDLGHVRTADMMADCLTKASVKPDALLQAVDTGVLPNVDASPPFRSLLKHKAYAVAFLARVIDPKKHVFSDITTFMGEPVHDLVHAYCANPAEFTSLLGESVGTPAEAMATHDAHRWHTHACARCDSHYTHFHECDDDDTCHIHGAYCCCNSDCPESFHQHPDTMHNPYHSRSG